MPVCLQEDLRHFLADFVEAHRGARRGTMFGMPAAYAGRKLFACVAPAGGIICKLPPEIARSAKGQPFTFRDRKVRGWALFTPRTPGDRARLVPLLEIAARHVASTDSSSSRPTRTRKGTAR